MLFARKLFLFNFIIKTYFSNWWRSQDFKSCLFDKCLKINLKSKIGKKSLGQILLTPTKIYVKEILELQKRVNLKNIAHITGGGLIGNLKRIIPSNLKINLYGNSLFNFHKNLFLLLQKAANLSDEDMLDTFNCGNGMVIVISKNDLEKLKKSLAKLKLNFKIIGSYSSCKKSDAKVTIS